MRTASIRSALAFLLAIPLSAQTLVVDVNNGPGTNYTSIEAAVAAAADGAMIVVRPGQYFESSLTISAKSLTMLSDTGGVEIFLPPNVPLRIESLGPSQRVLIRGFDVRQVGATGIVDIECENNQGRVALEGLWGNTFSRRLVATNCDWLVATECSFQGGGVWSFQSRLVMEQCAVVSNGQSICWQVGGQVHLVDTLISSPPTFNPPNTGYLLQGGEVRVSADSLVWGGIQLPFNTRGPCFAGHGTVRVDPMSSLAGSLPLFPATISVTTTQMPYVTTTMAGLGSTTIASLHGPIGHLGILAVGFPGPITSIPILADPCWLESSSVITQGIGSPAPLQPMTTITTIPNIPGLRGITLVWHGFTFDATAGLQVSDPSVRVIR